MNDEIIPACYRFAGGLLVGILIGISWMDFHYPHAVLTLRNLAPWSMGPILNGGEGGIRTLGTLLEYGALAKRCFRPLSHLTYSRKRLK